METRTKRGLHNKDSSRNKPPFFSLPSSSYFSLPSRMWKLLVIGAASSVIAVTLMQGFLVRNQWVIAYSSSSSISTTVAKNKNLRAWSEDKKNVTSAHEILSVKMATKLPSSFPIIDRIIYFNSFLNWDKNEKMKYWLSSQQIPFHRIEIIHGEADEKEEDGHCQETTNGERPCQKSSPILPTYVYLQRYGGFQVQPLLEKELETIIAAEEHADNEVVFGEQPRFTVGTPYLNLTGTTLILHKDSLTIPDMKHLEDTLSKALENAQIPPHWDVVRLKCCTLEEYSYIDDSSMLHILEHNASWSLQGDTTSDALLWRDTGLSKLISYSREGWAPPRLHALTPRQCLCINSDETPTSSSTLEAPVESLKPPNAPKISLDRILQQQPARNSSTAAMAPRHSRKIQRVYYNNVEKNTLRRKMVEFWLTEDPSFWKIPYKRIPAQAGKPEDQCTAGKNSPERCRGIAGLAKTLVHILDQEDTSGGISLILEDDYSITDSGFQRMEASLAMVPDDWDIIRFDCWGTHQVDLQWINPFVAKTNQFRLKEDCKSTGTCWFCGGTHALLVNDESTERVKKMWGQTPYQDVDCVIGQTPWINSYCVNIGIGDMYKLHNEVSDIPSPENLGK